MGEFASKRGFPSERASNAGNVSMSSRHYGSWWRHARHGHTFDIIQWLAFCKRNTQVNGRFPSQRATSKELWFFFLVWSSCWRNSRVTGESIRLCHITVKYLDKYPVIVSWMSITENCDWMRNMRKLHFFSRICIFWKYRWVSARMT